MTGSSEVSDIFEQHLRAVWHTGPISVKYRKFESAIAELLGVPANDIYTSHVPRAGNFDVRMTQSDRARDAKLLIALIPSETAEYLRPGSVDFEAIEVAAFRFARYRKPGISVLLVRDISGKWQPVSGIEPAYDEPACTLSFFIEFFEHFNLETYFPPPELTGRGVTVTLTPQEERLLRVMLSRPDTTRALYEIEPNLFARLIENDVSARDVVAIAHRRSVVERFRRLLHDPGFFEDAAEALGGKEAVWQNLLEENPWILGVSLAGQLLTSWDEEKLEQIVAGFSVGGPGKRVDALMRTNGSIRAMVFAEIKHHETALLGPTEYRPSCWPPSPQLAGGVVQAQRTVQLAIRQIGERLADEDEHGVETGDYTYLVRPRHFLILGNLADFRGAHGINRQKYESFELFRRNIREPEILTFDELLARAEWHVESVDREAESHLGRMPLRAVMVCNQLCVDLYCDAPQSTYASD